MTILLALALVPEVISRYVGLAVIPEMMDRAHYYPILTLLALATAVVIFTNRKEAAKPVASTLHNLRLWWWRQPRFVPLFTWVFSLTRTDKFVATAISTPRCKYKKGQN